MASQTLAVKYRPKEFEDITEQNAVKIILQQQLETNTIKNAYLFCGPAGCGKTTAARIFANKINHNEGNAIEMDAASNSGVDDVRSIIQQAKTKSLDSEYKVFIIDECHSISNTGWQAFLKLIEEPPAKSIFIFCTTDPQKIPKTILSRVQRYDFQRISQKGIVERLFNILDYEGYFKTHMNQSFSFMPLEYLAKLADGGMRDAITLLDKCLSYSSDLTVENVVKALGIANYDTMFKLTDACIEVNDKKVFTIIEDLYSAGVDIKQFVSQYIQFLLDVLKYAVGCGFEYLQMPNISENVAWVENNVDKANYIRLMLSAMINLKTDIKYSQTPKYDFEAVVAEVMTEINCR